MTASRMDPVKVYFRLSPTALDHRVQRKTFLQAMEEIGGGWEFLLLTFYTIVFGKDMLVYLRAQRAQPPALTPLATPSVEWIVDTPSQSMRFRTEVDAERSARRAESKMLLVRLEQLESEREEQRAATEALAARLEQDREELASWKKRCATLERRLEDSVRVEALEAKLAPLLADAQRITIL